MDTTWMSGMMIIKEVLANMGRGGRSQDEEERIRRIMRDVMSETTNASASERDMMRSMMQLLEQNVTKHSAELQTTTQERDHYKAKMEELNHRMEQMMRDEGAHPSGGEGPGLTARQKRLAEMWEELKDMRQSKRSDQTTQGKPFSRGGARGGRGAGGARSDQTTQGKPFSRGGVRGGSGAGGARSDQTTQGKPFSRGGVRGGRGAGGARSDQTTQGKPFSRGGARGGRGAGGASDSRNRPNDFSFSKFTPEEIEALKLVLKQQETAAECTGGSGNRPNDFSSNHFTPEEIEALKSVLKQRKTAPECTEKPGSVPLLVNPSKTAVKKKKKETPKGAGVVLPDDSDSDEEDALKSSKEGTPTSGDAIDTVSDTATDAKPVADSKKKKKKRGKNQSSKDQAAAEQKPEGLSPLEIFTASGFDVSQIVGLNMDDAVRDMMLIAKDGANILSCQPETVRELVEFKQKYPNAQTIIVKTSEQK